MLQNKIRKQRAKSCVLQLCRWYRAVNRHYYIVTLLLITMTSPSKKKYHRMTKTQNINTDKQHQKRPRNEDELFMVTGVSGATGMKKNTTWSSRRLRKAVPNWQIFLVIGVPELVSKLPGQYVGPVDTNLTKTLYHWQALMRFVGVFGSGLLVCHIDTVALMPARWFSWFHRRLMIERSRVWLSPLRRAVYTVLVKLFTNTSQFLGRFFFKRKKKNRR